MNTNHYILALPGIEQEEIALLQDILRDMTEEQQKTFMMIYQGKRRDPQTILIFTLLGFVGFAGVQRFATDQIGMGILYFFTAGICFIGTIIDLVNYKSLTWEYNRKQAMDAAARTKTVMF